MSDSKSDGADAASGPATHFIHHAVARHTDEGRFGGKVLTRFPPEPNGFLHIGHAKAIAVSFTVAERFGGKTNLRFDDTNPLKEDEAFVEAIQADIRWLGFDWEDRLFFASDYFGTLYEYAVRLIEAGKAYVCDLTAAEIRETRGTLTAAGQNSPHRDRSVEENLDLFARMRTGEFPDGTRTLRAKIDMASGNLNLRDPVMYRISHAHHHRTGNAWCIYPTYDWAHGQSDSIEGITHSLCSLEFEDHRPLYDWFLDQLGVHHPQQIEFARLNLNYTIMSKRMLRQLVEEGHVDGWDDPRMPTLAGMRRRGYTPEAIRNFCEIIGVAKQSSTVDIALLEHCVREHLNQVATRLMVVLRPIKVVLTNYPEDQVEELECVNNPEDPSAGSRPVPFSRELYIEDADFREDPPKKFFRLAPGREVRLRYAYFITCDEVIKDADGNVVELRCRYDPATRGGDAPDGRRVKATLHWVSAAHAVPLTVRLYDRLFSVEDPSDVPHGGSFLSHLNPESMETLTGCMGEPAIASARPEDRIQFERQGYFTRETHQDGDAPIWLRTVSLRDSWARIERAMAAGQRGA